MNTTAMIEMSNGWVALIDTDDLPRVAAYEWRLPDNVSTRFPMGSQCRRGNSCETVFLHRLIANAGPDDMVIHRNHDTLDNRRENLVVMGRLTALASLALAPFDHLNLNDTVAAD